jgi:hypothetical protein
MEIPHVKWLTLEGLAALAGGPISAGVLAHSGGAGQCSDAE